MSTIPTYWNYPASRTAEDFPDPTRLCILDASQVLLPYLPCAALLLDNELTILHYNPMAQTILATETNSLQGFVFTNFIADDQQNETADKLRQAGITPSTTSCTMKKDGISAETVDLKVSRLPDTSLLVLLEINSSSTTNREIVKRLQILEAQYEKNPAGILLVNERMEMLSYNNEFLRMWSIPAHIQTSRNDEKSLQTVLSQVKSPEQFLEKIYALYDTPNATSTDEIELIDGRIFFRHSYPIFSAHKYMARAWYFLDITALKSAKQANLLQQKYQETILEHINDGIIACDADGQLTLFNQASQKILGEQVSSVPMHQWAQHFRLLKPDGKEILPADENPLFKALQDHPVKNEEFIVEDRLKNQRTLRANGQAMYDNDDNKLGAVVSLHDITDLKKIRQKLRHMAYHDHLTKLPNRRLFHDLMELCMRQADRESKQVGILFLDLDNFKQINDRFGHDTGDSLLKHLTSSLLDCLRESDIVCRWGGDEFVVALPGLSTAKDAEGVAQKICLNIAAAIHAQTEYQEITVSIGISMYPRDGKVADKLIRKADVAMLSTKKKGKNSYTYTRKIS